jgi:hypothetical protein
VREAREVRKAREATQTSNCKPIADITEADVAEEGGEGRRGGGAGLLLLLLLLVVVDKFWPSLLRCGVGRGLGFKGIYLMHILSSQR